jgi:hypothetical protein
MSAHCCLGDDAIYKSTLRGLIIGTLLSRQLVVATTTKPILGRLTPESGFFLDPGTHIRAHCSIVIVHRIMKNLILLILGLTAMISLGESCLIFTYDCTGKVAATCTAPQYQCGLCKTKCCSCVSVHFSEIF